MPKFKITQHRDATQLFHAIIEADSKMDALAAAHEDECTWIRGDVLIYDDREIPLEEIEPMPETGGLLQPPSVSTRIWVLRIDTERDNPSAEIYADEPSALAAFEQALQDYLTPAQRRLFAGNPRAAYDEIIAAEDGDFPYGHCIELDEQLITVTPID